RGELRPVLSSSLMLHLIRRLAPAVNGGSRRASSEIRCASSRSPQQILRRSYDLVRFEPELPLQLLERRRRPKRVHADDAPRRADVSLPSKGRCFRRNTLHHAAISANDINVVVEDLESGPIVPVSEPLLGNGHTHAGGDTLP